MLPPISGLHYFPVSLTGDTFNCYNHVTNALWI